MNKKITVSAPGKLMLLGEHAVVYNHPCLVTAINQRMRVTIETLSVQEFQLYAADVQVVGYKKSLSTIGRGDIPKGARFVEIALKNVFDCINHTYPKKALRYNPFETGIQVTTTSEFSSQFGFGSSSASTVSVVKAVSALLGLSLSQKEIFDLSYQTVLDIQGTGSGFDIAAAVYGGTLYFVTGGKSIQQLPIDTLPLVIGYSGIKADTGERMAFVKEKFASHIARLEEIYQAIEILVNKAKEACIALDFAQVGRCMNDNQKLLRELGVSIPKLDTMVASALSAGAYGAKLSGAGGGDCMIALVAPEKRNAVMKAIQAAGGKVLPGIPNAEGVRIENI